MTFITTHGDQIVGIHKSQTDANGHVLNFDNGETATLEVLNIDLPLDAEVGWYVENNAVVENLSTTSAIPDISIADDGQAIESRLVLIDTIMRSSNTSISMTKLVDDINAIHRRWLLNKLTNIMSTNEPGKFKRARYVSTVVTNLYFMLVYGGDSFGGQVVHYLPSDRNNLSATKTELDVRIKSIKLALAIAKLNAKKWVNENTSDSDIVNTIKLGDTHAFPE